MTIKLKKKLFFIKLRLVLLDLSVYNASEFKVLAIAYASYLFCLQMIVFALK